MVQKIFTYDKDENFQLNEKRKQKNGEIEQRNTDKDRLENIDWNIRDRLIEVI